MSSMGFHRHFQKLECTGACMLQIVAWSIRNPIAVGTDSFLVHGEEVKPPGGHAASWYRQALAGELESFIVLPHHRKSVGWTDRKGVETHYLKSDPVFIIPVQRIAQKVAQKMNA